MNWRAVVIVLLVVLSLINAFVRLRGDWGNFLAVLGGHAFSIFGGIYPYLFNKGMLGFPGTTLHTKFNPDTKDTDTSLKRLIFFFGHTSIYLLLFLVSS